MSLDRSLVPAPSSMMDMIHKIKHGLYDIDFRNIKKVSSQYSPLLNCFKSFLFLKICVDFVFVHDTESIVV